MRQVDLYQKVYDAGLDGIVNMDVSAVKAELAAAKALPKDTEQHKEIRKVEIELAKKKACFHKNYLKHFGSVNEFKEPEMSVLEGFFNVEDKCDDRLEELNKELREAKRLRIRARLLRLRLI